MLAATSGASFKLIFICAVVGWMLKTGRLPKATASVLTQVKPALNPTRRENTVVCVCGKGAIFTPQVKLRQRAVLSGVLALCVQVVYTLLIPRLKLYMLFVRCRAAFIFSNSGLSHAGGVHRANTSRAVHQVCSHIHSLLQWSVTCRWRTQGCYLACCSLGA